MAIQYDGSKKICATCTYWDGRRRVALTGDVVEGSSNSPTGQCLNLKCAYNGRETRAIFSNCDSFQQWSALRRR